eukprot:8681631-Pyramimonas_sp.AAC.1
MQSKAKGRRTVQNMLIRPLHQLLHHEVTKTPLAKLEMQDSFKSREWPRVYREHRVYLDSDPGELVVPVAVFVDSAQYGGAAGAGRQRSIVT